MGSRGLRPLVGCGAKPRIAEQSSAAAQTNSHAQKNRQKAKEKEPKKAAALRNTEPRLQTVWRM